MTSALFTFRFPSTESFLPRHFIYPCPIAPSLLLSLPSYIEMATQPPKRQYDFSVQIPARRPRAWERVPSTSFAPRHRGRKVWKRYELRTKQGTTRSDEGNGEGGTTVERPVKRLRSTRGIAGEKEGAGGTEGGYVPTMRSQAPGTPRSMLFLPLA